MNCFTEMRYLLLSGRILIEDDLPAERLEIQLVHGGGDKRMITFTPIGERYEKICEGIFL